MSGDVLKLRNEAYCVFLNLQIHKFQCLQKTLQLNFFKFLPYISKLQFELYEDVIFV